MNEEVYKSLVGGLIYLTHTRPDLAYYVSIVARFMQSPSRIHFGVTTRILQYVAGAKSFVIWCQRTKAVNLVGSSDSDWPSDVDDRRSLSAYVFSIGSGVISWSSKKQNTFAQSSTEAEYISASGATCQAIWLRRVLEDLGWKQTEATEIHCDNKSAINLSKNPIMHNRSKHIELKYHFLREMVIKDQVKLEYCNTHNQLADVLTKALSIEKFVYFRHIPGVRRFQSREDEEK